MQRFVQRVLHSLLALFVFSLTLPAALAADGDRSAKNKVEPVYPELARRMRIAGTVKLQVTIAPDGTVTTIKPLGGHPLLIDSAINSVKLWKYETGRSETTQVVNVVFKND